MKASVFVYVMTTLFTMMFANIGWSFTPIATQTLKGVEGKPSGLSGSILVVGNPRYATTKDSNGYGGSHTGALSVFTKNAQNQWEENATLLPNDSVSKAYQMFGSAASVSGSHVVGVGECYRADTVSQAYVFSDTGSAWSSGTKLLSQYPLCGSVDMSGETLVAMTEMGRAEAFKLDTGGVWRSQGLLGDLNLSQYEIPRGYKRHAIDIDGDTVVIAFDATNTTAIGQPTNTYVQVYAREGDTWSKQADLMPSDQAFRWDSVVALQDNTIMVGDPHGNNESGRVVIFERSEEQQWTQTQIMTSPAIGDRNYGSRLELTNNSLIVNAKRPFKKSYMYHLLTDGWSKQATLDSWGGEMAISGNNGVIVASGTVKAFSQLSPGGNYIGLNATQAFSDQDNDHRGGTVMANDTGTAITLTNNRWRVTREAFTITADTVLEFDVTMTGNTEIHGIGFESDNQTRSDRIFNLSGSQDWWGIRDYNYSGIGRKHFKIPVGEHYTGESMNLVLASDNDWGSGNSVTFSNIQLCEGECESLNSDDPYKDMLLDLSSTQAFVEQDSRDGDVDATFGGMMLSLTGNRWRASAHTFEVTEDTVLEFDFYGFNFSEIHAIGFGDVDSLDPEHVFQLAGHQNFGHQGYRYGGGEESFSIPVGEFFTGSNMRLVFISDDDVGFNVTTSFSMVKVCEVSCSDISAENTGSLLNLDEMDSFSDQDLHSGLGVFELNSDNTKLTVSGNRWLASYDVYKITSNTVLEFDFSSNSIGEVQGIGFNGYGESHEEQIFNLTGSQEDWGVTEYRYTGSGETQSFSIRIGDRFQGDNLRLVLVNDDDASGDPYAARVTISNVRLCENVCQ